MSFINSNHHSSNGAQLQSESADPNSPIRRGRYLFTLLIVNVITSLLHYADNILFFHAYPEPHWISPKIIDAFWFIMTPFAVLSYACYKRGLETYSYLCLYLYSLMSLLVLGHYRYGSMGELSLKINLLILVEAFAAFVLIFYTLSLQLQAKTQTS